MENQLISSLNTYVRQIRCANVFVYVPSTSCDDDRAFL
jgi:hypothetical protein